jgi:hypothetical protein
MVAFYVPDCKQREVLKETIEENGGIVYDVFEAYSYQIKPDNECENPEEFFTGKIYSANWIHDSIQKGEFIKDNSKYLLGFNKNPKRRSIPKGRCPYTITEVLQMFDFVEKQQQNTTEPKQVSSLKFWRAIERRNMIPDRSAQSLKTAYRKFCKLSKEEFVKQALLNDEDGRRGFKYSHLEEEPPIFGPDYDPNSCPTTVTKKPDIPTPFEDEKPQEFKEESEDDDQIEFVLAVDDLESVVSYRPQNTGHVYSAQAGQKRPDRLLNELFTPEATVRVKIEEGKEVTKGRDTVYDMESLQKYLKGKGHLKIEKHTETGTRRVLGEFKEKVQEEYFTKLSKELHKLARQYSKKMDEIHMLFMEVSCDLEDLKRLLKGEQRAKWSMLEDLAIQSDDGSVELKHVADVKGEGQVKKRKKFLELM